MPGLPKLSRPRTSHPVRLADQTPPGAVVLDFDGTLAPFRLDPEAVRLSKTMRNALHRLNQQRTLAIVSGRPLSFLRKQAGDLGMILIGSHGAEANRRALRLPKAPLVPSKVDRLLDEARKSLRVEKKPHGRVIHFRAVAADRRETLEALWFNRLSEAAPDGWEVMHGNAIVELRPRNVHKGGLLEPLRQYSSGSLAAILGDDLTDEDMFRCAREGELTVLVGPSRPTEATHRLHGIQAVGDYLRRLSARR